MKYQFSDENIEKRLRSNKLVLAIQYSTNLIILLIILAKFWSSPVIILKVLLILGILSLPFAWRYFYNKFKSKLYVSFEIIDDFLVVKEADVLKIKIPLRSIRSVTPMKGGHKVEGTHHHTFILDGIVNKEALIHEIEMRRNG